MKIATWQERHSRSQALTGRFIIPKEDCMQAEIDELRAENDRIRLNNIMSAAEDAKEIEGLERELTAATLRIDNDAAELERIKGQHKQDGLDAAMMAQDYCRNLWGSARGRPEWREAHNGFVAGYLAAGAQPVPQEPVELKITDKWESCRVYDYNRGWNECIAQMGIEREPAPVQAVCASKPPESGAQDDLVGKGGAQERKPLATDGVVGWRWIATCGSGAYQLTDYEPMRGYSYKAPVYELQPAQERKPLTKTQIDDIVYKCRRDGKDTTYDIINAAIEATIKERNQ